MKMVLLIALAFLLFACVDDNSGSTKKIENNTTFVGEAAAVLQARTGQDIYIACSACHGADASKVALGQSKPIKGWGYTKVIEALNGYKDGTYGGTMKGVMKGQVLALTPEDIRLVSIYISEL